MSGYTNIPNKLWDWMIDNPSLSNQTRILAMVVRFTVCFQRQFHNLSLSFIANRLEMKRQNVQRDVQSMIDSGLIREKREGQNRLLAINCDLASVIKNDDSLLEGVIKNDDSTVIKNDDRSVITFDNQEIKQSKLKNKTIVQDDSFEQFWNRYPRKEGKADARKAFDAAIKKETFETILNGASGYASFVQREKRELKYVKLPGGWLRNEAWKDYQEVQKDSTILRLIANQQTVSGESDERLLSIYEHRRNKQAGQL